MTSKGKDKQLQKQIPFGDDKQEKTSAKTNYRLGVDLFGYAFDGVVGGEYGAFLPGYEVG
jgi:hypothetical protein